MTSSFPSLPMNLEQITALATSLRSINQRLLATAKAEAIRVWYQGGEPYFDLFLELEGEEISWFQFTLRGRSISWHRYRDGWRTGNTNEGDTPHLHFQPASKLVQLDAQLDREFVEIVRAIVQVRQEEPIFAQLEKLLREIPLENSGLEN
jgi:hypothetical protein